MRYVAFIHRDPDSGFGISFPDFPGCVSVGGTVDHAIRCGGDALAFHVEGMREAGEAVPAPRSVDEIRADCTISDWRDGAAIAFVPLILDTNAPQRINVSIDRGLLSAIDDEARHRGVSRSAFLAAAARHELEAT